MTPRALSVAITCLLVAGCASERTSTGAAAHASAPNMSALSAPAVLAPVISSPAPALSSPAEMGSDTPEPLPTPSFGSEGTLPPMPPGGRSTDSASPNNIYEAQGVIAVFADEVAATAQNEAGYCDVTIDLAQDRLTVWWHGSPPADVVAVLDRARAAHVVPIVRASVFDHRSLAIASGKLARLMQQFDVSELGVSNDCSGLDVALVKDRPSTETAVQAIVGKSVPIHFTEMPFPTAI